MGELIRTLCNRSARGFMWVCLALTLLTFGAQAALHRYEDRSAAICVNEYRLALAGRLAEEGFTDEQAAKLVTDDNTPEQIQAGERILSGYGYSADSPVGSEFTFTSHTASGLAAAAALLICLAAGLAFFGSAFRNVRRLTAHIEHGEKMPSSADLDLTLLAEAADALKKQTAHLITTIGEEKQFLADYLDDFSHQIKTPCTGLMLNNDILSSAPMPFDEQLGYLRRDRKCLEKISLLVRESLKLARLDAGAVAYSFEDADIGELTAESVSQLAAIAEENDAELINEVGQGTTLRCDRLWLCEAVTNLIKNAAEHTHGGQVRIYSECDPITVRLIIEDNGCGISEDELPKVFRRFYSKSRAVNSSSVGIGMSAAKRIVEDMNGRIFIDSEVGKGTKIILEFLRTVT